MPPVEIIDDDKAMNELLEAHYEQKQMFKDLLTGEADLEELLEVMEMWIGTPNMDRYVAETEEKLNKIII